jgi:hypothetical protein
MKKLSFFVKFCFCGLFLLLVLPACAQSQDTTVPALQKHWLFVWRDMHDTKEVDRVIARLPQAIMALSSPRTWCRQKPLSCERLPNGTGLTS